MTCARKQEGFLMGINFRTEIVPRMEPWLCCYWDCVQAEVNAQAVTDSRSMLVSIGQPSNLESPVMHYRTLKAPFETMWNPTKRQLDSCLRAWGLGLRGWGLGDYWDLRGPVVNWPEGSGLQALRFKGFGATGLKLLKSRLKNIPWARRTFGEHGGCPSGTRGLKWPSTGPGH